MAPPDADSINAAVAAITARDPAFNLDAVLAEAQQAFWLVGQAHAKCQPEMCQGVLSPGLASRERSAIEDACRKKRCLAPSDEDAKTGELLSIGTDSSGDTVSVHFVSTWSPVEGTGKPERRVQNWCFHRPAGARTLQTEAGQRCVNCGAALSSSAGTCRYCGALIGSGNGWRVIRIDEVSAQSASEAVAAMRTIVDEIMAARRTADESAHPGSVRTYGRRRAPGRMVAKWLLLLLLAGAILVFVGAAGSGRLHQDVAKFLPFTRHPELTGTLDLRGPLSAADLSAMQKAPMVELGGRCQTYSDRTSWDFRAKLPDASTFDLEFSLPPGGGGAGSYRPPRLTVSAHAENSQQSSSWASASGTTAVLTLTPAGGGSLLFDGLAPGETGGHPLSGRVSWTCSIR